MPMTPNSPSQPKPVQRGVRAGFLLMLLLLTVVLVAALTLFRGSSQPGKHERSGALAQTNSSNVTQHQPVPEAKPTQPTPVAFSPPTAADSATAKLIGELFDDSLSLSARQRAARALAKLGSDAALAALKTALATNCPPYLKAAIAEDLGDCPNPGAKALLASLATGQDEITARGAVRGLELRGDADAVNMLGNLLFNTQTPLSVRTEAALALGNMNLPDTQDLLARAATEIQNEDVVEDVLTSLGERPFSQTQTFFSNFLESGNVSVESKVAALEALGSAQGDATLFLLKYLHDPNAELRAAAAWALTTASSAGDLGPQLADALKQETDPNVRMRIYQALETQSGGNPLAVLPLVQSESDPATQLAGFTYLAETLRSSPAPEITDYFNRTAIPKLTDTALNSSSSQNRLAAVIALEQAGTPAALGALQEIARQSNDRKVVAVAEQTLSKQASK